MSSQLPSTATSLETWLWLDSQVVSSKLAESLSLGNPQVQYYTWDPEHPFEHLVDTLEISGCYLHLPSSWPTDDLWKQWERHGLASLLNSKAENFPVILWGSCPRGEVPSFLKKARLLWGPAQLNPLTVDSDRHFLLNQNKCD